MADDGDPSPVPEIRPPSPDLGFFFQASPPPVPPRSSTGPDRPGGSPSRRAAWVALAVTASVSAIAWFCVAGLVVVYVTTPDSPEGTKGFTVAVLMQFVLAPALGFTAASAVLYREVKGGRWPLAVAVVAWLAALVVTCAWWEILQRLP